RLDDEVRSLKADFDAKSSYYNIDVEHWGKEPPGPKKDELKAAVDRRKQELDELEAKLQGVKARLDEKDREYAREVRGKVEPAEKDLADAEDSLKGVTAAFDRFAKVTAQKRWTFGDTFRALPVLDAFASPTRINQYTLADLPIDYGGFKDVTRYDRCTTCH